MVLKMYQIAVCDDEPSVCNIVAEEIKKWNQDIKKWESVTSLPVKYFVFILGKH